MPTCTQYTQTDYAQMLSGSTSHRLIKPGGKEPCWNYNTILRKILLHMLHDYPHPQCRKPGRLSDSRRGIATMSAALHYKVQRLVDSIIFQCEYHYLSMFLIISNPLILQPNQPLDFNTFTSLASIIEAESCLILPIM